MSILVKTPQQNTPNLNDNHREELHGSGITDQTIADAGIHSAASGTVKEILGWSQRYVDWGAAMVFPYDRNGDCKEPYRRVKLDFPRTNDAGKEIKYESPKGSKNRAYFPPGVLDQIQSAGVILITEGEKKALAVSQYGKPCIGLVGVWGSQRKRKRTDQGRAYGKRRLIPDLESIEWKDKRVFILFDSDAVDNDLVRLAETRLSEVLTDLEAEVCIIRVPKIGDGKTGIDDYLVAQDDPTEALRELIAGAKPAEEPPPPSPMDFGKMFLDDHFRSEHGLELRWWRDQFWRWDR